LNAAAFVARPSGAATRTASRLLCLLLALPPAAAQAEIYACTGKGRLPVYQNFPCQFDRLASAPDEGAATTPATRNGPQNLKAAVFAPKPPAPRVGMTTDQVRAIWGDPQDLTKEEFAKRDIETWTYANSRSIVFDRKGIVTSIHW
jgi:hypothetical protein